MTTTAQPAGEREVLTYDEFGAAARELAERVAADGFVPDLVLSVARGGLALGMALGYALDVKALSVVNVEFYTGVDQRLDEPVMLPPTPSLADLAGARILVADDIADTGHTLAMVRDHLAGHAAEVRVAVVYEKPRSVVRPDWAWRRTEAWVEFPWSVEPPVTAGPPAP